MTRGESQESEVTGLASDFEPFETKMRAVSCYRSQLVEGRSAAFPTVLDDVRDRARYWGWSIGKKFGEPFSSREEIGLSSLKSLIGNS